MLPATAANYVPVTIVCFTFNRLIRRRHYFLVVEIQLRPFCYSLFEYRSWFCSDPFYFTVPENSSIGATNVQTWCGNTAYMNTNDWLRIPRKTSNPSIGHFGPPF